MSLKLMTGDVLRCLAKLPDESIQTCVTSPPYWGLRDYGVSGQIGLEPTPEAFVAKMVAVFREVKRVLRPDGTCWVNLGDSYAHNGACGGDSPDGARKARRTDADKQREMSYRVPRGLKPKDLIGIPWRVAFALQADGWFLRSDIIWHKPNPMPESVRDRPTKSHEYVFLLTKRARYYYDADAVREKATPAIRVTGPGNGSYAQAIANGRKPSGNGKLGSVMITGDSRNSRSVWTITPKPFRGAHFATFPPALVERCVKAGTSERGACPTCGAPWERVTEVVGQVKQKWGTGTATADHRIGGIVGKSDRGLRDGMVNVKGTLGFRPTCSCPAAEPIPCTVLDPFSGAGTVGLVCRQLGRDFIGIDLNPSYVRMARRRIAACPRPA